MELQKTKYCKQCKLFKDINEFSTYKSNGIERIQGYCKPCKKLIGQKYYHDNKQKYKQRHKNLSKRIQIIKKIIIVIIVNISEII